MTYTRREFGSLVAATVPAAGLLPTSVLRGQSVPPASRFAGVHIGINAPYSFRGEAATADEIMAAMKTIGASALELRSGPVEAYLGAPANAGRGGGGAGRGGRRGAAAAAGAAGGGRAGAATTAAASPTEARGARGAQPTPEQQAAQTAAAQALEAWRLALSMDQVEAFRRKYEDAGLFIEIVKFDNITTMSDAVLDYSFRLARTLGARAISCEIAPDHTRRLGQFADKHQMPIGYHGHATTGPADWEKAFAEARYNAANVDIGHYVAGHSASPVPFITQHASRITHVHLKDRKTNNGPNVMWGQGDTPIVEVLRLIRDNKWNIQATIELEYPVPEGSSAIAELARCVQYCKDALV